MSSITLCYAAIQVLFWVVFGLRLGPQGPLMSNLGSLQKSGGYSIRCRKKSCYSKKRLKYANIAIYAYFGATFYVCLGPKNPYFYFFLLEASITKIIFPFCTCQMHFRHKITYPIFNSSCDLWFSVKISLAYYCQTLTNKPSCK